ncbi:MAG: hypothetical protein GYB66_11760 [Chloroflexi bacterium]|nr:hypothetical protein [Chloroflexota bacterium]
MPKCIFLSRLGLALSIALWILVLPVPANAQDPPNPEDAIAIITSPLPGATISGEVVITGSAGHPDGFAYYELEFDNQDDPNEVWLPIGERVAQQITNGTLGIWNTVGRGIADGTYQIRLRVFLNNPESPPIEIVVTDLQLINNPPTPVPTSPPQPELGSSPGPEAGPSPTSLIVLPPTNTPLPTLGVRNGNNGDGAIATGTAGDSEDNGDGLSFSQIQNAFCGGSVLAIVFFLGFGGYLLARARLRPRIRQIMWQIRNDFDND